MNFVVKLFFFLTLNLVFNTKIVIANVLDNVGACAGVVIGNASVDFSLGDQKGFDEGIKLGITAYVSEIFANNYSKKDITIADKILASNTDKVINAANTQTFDETIFEEVIKCYRMLSILVMKNADSIKSNSKKINNIINQRNKLLRRMLSAG